jgi:NAD-dependent deacetylase
MSIGAALRLLANARRILVFTGAGISTESGIPDYRGPEGIWRTRDPSRYTIQAYLASPEVRRERWRDRLQSPIDAARPNAAHDAVAHLQHRGRAGVVVTPI